MGMRSTTQSFQFNVPFDQLFPAATQAVQAVKKATLTRSDPNGRMITFDTPMGMMSWGENLIVGFIPNEEGVIAEVTCTTKGLPNLMQDSLNRKQIGAYIAALSNLVQSPAVEVAVPDGAYSHGSPASFIVTRPGPSHVRSARALRPSRAVPAPGRMGRYCPDAR